MNNSWAIYDQSNGKILRWVTCPPNQINDQLQVGELFYPDCPKEATHIIQGNPKKIEELADLKQIRLMRNTLLSLSDWTQLPDNGLTEDVRNAWTLYRQQLRDFPKIVDLNNVEWPTKPSVQ